MAAQVPPSQDVSPAKSEETATAMQPEAVAGARLIRFNGRAFDASGQPMAGVAGVTFAIYAEQTGGAALWQETQNLATDTSGRFSALLGARSSTGVPVDLFADGAPRWLAVLPHAPGVGEQPRVLLVSVPYALQAANAEQLGGLPASAFVRANTAAALSESCASAAATPDYTARISFPSLAANGAVAGYVPMFADSVGDLQNSGFFQSSNGFVGIGTTTPAFNLNIISQADPAAVTVEGYGSVGVNFIGRRARGTSTAPTALLAGDNLFTLQGRGYGSTGFSTTSRSNVKFFAVENWTDTAQGAYVTFATTQKGTTPLTAPERMRITDAGQVGIGTTAPDQMLTVAGAIHSTTGGFVFPDGSTMLTAQSSPTLLNGSLTLAAGTNAGTAGNADLQTVGDITNTMSDRYLVVGAPKTLTGVVPTANLFSVHLAAGDAAGGKVKFTLVASDGTNYAMETGEIIFLANPKGMSCAVVVSEYTKVPPTYTNTVLAVPPIGQTGSLNAQCLGTTFSGDPGLEIYDTAPTSFTPTTHKIYYTIENQSQAAVTLRP